MAFFGIGAGPSKQENDIFNLLSSSAGFELGTGKSAVSMSDSFWKDILSGDPTKIAAVLAPQTKVIQGQAAQQKKQISEFGTRSGGSASRAAAIDTNTTSAIQDLVNRSRTQAAGALGAEGLSLLGIGAGTGAEAFSEATTIHDQQAEKWNEIFQSIGAISKALASVVGDNAFGKTLGTAGGILSGTSGGSGTPQWGQTSGGGGGGG